MYFTQNHSRILSIDTPRLRFYALLHNAIINPKLSAYVCGAACLWKLEIIRFGNKVIGTLDNIPCMFQTHSCTMTYT